MWWRLLRQLWYRLQLHRHRRRRRRRLRPPAPRPQKEGLLIEVVASAIASERYSIDTETEALLAAIQAGRQ